MCGISVVVALNGTSLNTSKSNGSANAGSNISEQLNGSLDRIVHRGPDSRGQWISEDKRVGLGHCRLAINDLSPDGCQPLHDQDDHVHAVVNGEIYDHDRLRDEIKRDFGYQFKGHSDSEVAIALYKIYGASFLSRLRGEFALCLYDSRTQFFIAARDRFGIKPLFWTIVDNKLLLSAEAKAFLPFGWKPEWDVQSIVDAGWNHDQRTLFKNVNKVRPGHYLTCSSFGFIETRQYWEIDFRDKRQVETRTEAEMIAGVREKMLESIRLRLRADVPVGIYLSGGIDSSVIAGMVTHLVKEQGEKMGNKDAKDRICCFSIAFDEGSGFDESDIANRTAQWLDVKYIKKLMNEEELAKRFEDATYHCEHHNPDLNFVGKYALSEVPNENGYKVVLTGEGADEHFAGYPMYAPDFLREPDYAWPQTQLSDTERQKQCVALDKDVGEYYTSIGADASNNGPCVASRQLNDITTPASMSAFNFTTFAPWTRCYGALDARDTIANNVDGRVRDLIQSKWHPLHSALYVWTKGHLANNFLSCLGDRTEMAHSVEARPPFLDHKLTEYVNFLPPSVKLRWNAETKTFTEKWILREASRPFVTKELFERKKHPYTAPATWPAEGPLHKLFSQLVTKENVEHLGFVDWEKIEGQVERAFVGKDQTALRQTLIVAEWIVIAQKFGVATATPPQGW